MKKFGGGIVVNSQFFDFDWEFDNIPLTRLPGALPQPIRFNFFILIIFFVGGGGYTIFSFIFLLVGLK